MPDPEGPIIASSNHTEPQLWETALRVAAVLDGFPVNEALNVLEWIAPSIIKDGLTVDVTHQQYLAQIAELLPLAGAD